MAHKLEIIIGTYEEFLVGYELVQAKDEKSSLSQSFATRSHTASVRCVSSCGKYVASGGADDRIFVYDMKTRREIQVLMHHNGTVNAITFTPDGTHLLSGGEDGQMFALRTNTWQTDGVWKKAHGGSAVTHISCHPSGKLALTLGSDLTLRTWNLIKGRTVYTTNLKSKKSLGSMPDCISWSLEGDYFTITGPRVVEIWNVETAGMIKEQNCNSKPISVCWITNDDVLVGLESGEIMMISVNEDEEPKIFEAHKQRVKSICYLNGTLATASSSGEISVWTVDETNKDISKITTTDIGCRPTCMGLLDLTQFGDDYVIVKDEETEENTLRKNEIANKNANRQNIGSVQIEYEDEEDKQNIELETSLEDSIQKQENKKNNEKNIKRKKDNASSEIEEKLIPNKKLKNKDKNKKNSKSNNEWICSTVSPNSSKQKSDSNEEDNDGNQHNFVRIKKPILDATKKKENKNKILNKKKK